MTNARLRRGRVKYRTPLLVAGRAPGNNMEKAAAAIKAAMSSELAPEPKKPAPATERVEKAKSVFKKKKPVKKKKK
jgi:hypothetical protein